MGLVRLLVGVALSSALFATGCGDDDEADGVIDTDGGGAAAGTGGGGTGGGGTGGGGTGGEGTGGGVTGGTGGVVTGGTGGAGTGGTGGGGVGGTMEGGAPDGGIPEAGTTDGSIEGGPIPDVITACERLAACCPAGGPSEPCSIVVTNADEGDCGAFENYYCNPPTGDGGGGLTVTCTALNDNCCATLAGKQKTNCENLANAGDDPACTVAEGIFCP